MKRSVFLAVLALAVGALELAGQGRICVGTACTGIVPPDSLRALEDSLRVLETRVAVLELDVGQLGDDHVTAAAELVRALERIDELEARIAALEDSSSVPPPPVQNPPVCPPFSSPTNPQSSPAVITCARQSSDFRVWAVIEDGVGGWRAVGELVEVWGADSGRSDVNFSKPDSVHIAPGGRVLAGATCDPTVDQVVIP